MFCLFLRISPQVGSVVIACKCCFVSLRTCGNRWLIFLWPHVLCFFHCLDQWKDDTGTCLFEISAQGFDFFFSVLYFVDAIYKKGTSEIGTTF